MGVLYDCFFAKARTKIIVSKLVSFEIGLFLQETRKINVNVANGVVNYLKTCNNGVHYFTNNLCDQ